MMHITTNKYLRSKNKFTTMKSVTWVLIPYWILKKNFMNEHLVMIRDRNAEYFKYLLGNPWDRFRPSWKRPSQTAIPFKLKYQRLQFNYKYRKSAYTYVVLRFTHKNGVTNQLLVELNNQTIWYTKLLILQNSIIAIFRKFV